ncbi:hypothetical protein [Streptomyces sp. NPDC060194]|uniref:hypothetical protein n=1 Tax=Streptomyces sp. NPDC060194 TaxID=3347069 RepID=UPI00364A6599
MLVKVIAGALMLPVALVATAALEALLLFWMAVILVMGVPIVVIATMFGSSLSEDLSQTLGQCAQAMIEVPGHVFGRMYGSL